MKRILVFQSDNRFFLPVANGVTEIPFSIVSTWREEGANVEIRSVESHD